MLSMCGRRNETFFEGISFNLKVFVDVTSIYYKIPMFPIAQVSGQTGDSCQLFSFLSLLVGVSFELVWGFVIVRVRVLWLRLW